MITAYAALGSLIFALIALVSYFYNKAKDLGSSVQNNAIESQISAIDAKITANQNQIIQDQQNTAKEEANETNQSILDNLNNPPKS